MTAREQGQHRSVFDLLIAKAGGIQSPRVFSFFIKQVETLGIIVLPAQTLEMCIAAGAPDPKPDVGDPRENIPGHDRSDVCSPIPLYEPVCCLGNRSKTAERL
jgi:hypothetical protein